MGNNPPALGHPDSVALLNWIEREFRALTTNKKTFDFIDLQPLHVEPERLYTGLTVFADGSDWNPGSGEGVYTYYASAWHKLG